MTPKEFASLIRGALAPWDKEPSQDALRAYHEDLSHLPDDLLRAAVARVRTGRLREEAQPTSADFLAAAEYAARDARMVEKAKLHGSGPDLCASCGGTGFVITSGADGIERANRCTHGVAR